MSDRQPTPRRARDVVRLLPWLGVALLAAGVLYQVLVPPIVGLADNGDYERLMGPYGITYATDSYEQRYWNYVNRDYLLSEPRDTGGYLSSQELAVGAAYGLTRAFSDGRTFDLRTLGAVNAVLLLAAAALLVGVAARRLGTLRASVLGLLAALALGDVGYVEYLNSFYSEPASLVFFLLAFGVALHAILREPGGRTAWLWYAGFLASVVLLAGAKPQNGLVGLLLVPLAYRLWPRHEVPRVQPLRIAVALALVGLTVWLAFFTTPRYIHEANLYNAVFYEILRASDDPEADLRSLGLDPVLAEHAGTYAFQPEAPVEEPGFRAAFFDEVGWGDVLRFYALHPGRFAGLADRTATSAFLLRPRDHGNFERSAGRPPRAQSQQLDSWSSVGERLPRSGWLLGLFVLANLVAAGLKARRDRTRRDRLLTELHAAAIGIALLQFVVASIGEGELDTIKHLFLFNVAATACIAFLALYAVHAGQAIAASRRARVAP